MLKSLKTKILLEFMVKDVCKQIGGVLLFLLSISVIAQAQIVLPPLERTIAIDLSGNSEKEALKKIETTAGMTFAYRSDIVSTTNRLTRSYPNNTVREILDDMFQGNIQYKVKGNYVILRKVAKPADQIMNIEGYVINKVTNEKVPYASIYDTISLASTVSDQYGYYALKLKKKNSLHLSAHKAGFNDTTITMQWDGKGKGLLNFKVAPIQQPNDTTIEEKQSLLERFKEWNLFKFSRKNEANIDNIEDPLTKRGQFSLLPYVGTNGALSANTTVDYSFNLLGGINHQVKAAEVGGAFNINIDSVTGAQVAGFFNATGGHQKGAQVAGFMNLNASSFSGVQVGGFFNSVSGSFNGIQAAGFGNYASNIDGGQVSGFINIAKNNVSGIQVAGFINIADEVKGSQIGFVNINDTISGASIGFFNFSRTGYRGLEFFTNESIPVNMALKTGTHRFYNTFSVGVKPGGKYPLWSYGYGIGTSFSVSEKSRLFLDLQSFNTHRIEKYSSDLNLLNKLTLSYHFRLFKHLTVAAGPSFNVLLVDQHTTAYGTQLKDLAPYRFYENNTDKGLNISAWVGGYFAFQFF